MATEPQGTGRPGARPPGADDRRPLTWLGCGCAALVAAVLAFVVAGSFATWRAAEGFEESRDPAVAATRTREVVGWERLPAGYHPTGAMQMPLGMMRLAVFADAPPRPETVRPETPRPETAEKTDRVNGPSATGPAAAEDAPPAVTAAFFFVDMPDWMDREEKMARVFRGEEGDPGGIAQVEVQFEGREELGRGELAAAGADVLYYARRGELEIQEASFGLADEDAPPRSQPGIATMLLFDCPHLDRLRLGLWFTADPAPGTPTPEADLTGTPADPAAIADFLSHFALCG